MNSPDLAPLLVAAAAVLDDEGRVLMHRRPAGKHHGGLWEFPGGKVEPGERAEGALLREMAEETGLALDPTAVLPLGFATTCGPGAAANPSRQIVLLLYACTRYDGDPVAHEGGTLRWVAPCDIPALDLAPADRDLVERVVLRTV